MEWEACLGAVRCSLASRIAQKDARLTIPLHHVPVAPSRARLDVSGFARRGSMFLQDLTFQVLQDAICVTHICQPGNGPSGQTLSALDFVISAIGSTSSSESIAFITQSP
jgi:hypothetical protein